VRNFVRPQVGQMIGKLVQIAPYVARRYAGAQQPLAQIIE
jgi:hypothetical protein